MVWIDLYSTFGHFHTHCKFYISSRTPFLSETTNQILEQTDLHERTVKLNIIPRTIAILDLPTLSLNLLLSLTSQFSLSKPWSRSLNSSLLRNPSLSISLSLSFSLFSLWSWSKILIHTSCVLLKTSVTTLSDKTLSHHEDPSQPCSCSLLTQKQLLTLSCYYSDTDTALFIFHIKACPSYWDQPDEKKKTDAVRHPWKQIFKVAEKLYRLAETFPLFP